MKKAPYSETYHGIIIDTESIGYANSFENLNPKGPISEQPFEVLNIIYIDESAYLGNGNIRVNAAMIFRNQKDYSNIVTIMGTYALKEKTENLTTSKKVLSLVELLFENAKAYILEEALKGADGSDFELPPNLYSEEKIRSIVEKASRKS